MITKRLLFAGATLFLSTSPALAPWQRQEMSDPLRGANYSQFSLDGKFLTAPRDKPNATPTMIVRCIPGKSNRGHTNGKFMDGYVYVGGVMNSFAVRLPPNLEPGSNRKNRRIEQGTCMQRPEKIRDALCQGLPIWQRRDVLPRFEGREFL